MAAATRRLRTSPGDAGRIQRSVAAAITSGETLSTGVGALVACAARYVARNVVAAGLARRCEIQLSYGIGEEQPLAVTVETFGTGTVPDERIEQALHEVFDLRPVAVAETLGLRTLPAHRGGEFYRALAAYGQIGRVDLDAPWEREDQTAAVRRAVGRKG